MKNLTVALVSILSLSLGACLDVSDASDDTNTNDNGDETIATARIATNGISYPTAVAALTATPITGAQLTTTTAAGLASSANGRTVLTYLVSCALAEGDSFTSGNGYVFAGSVGAAPNWKTSALGSKEVPGVSGCFWSRVNAYGKNINVSLRGYQIGLVTNETTNYAVDEGAFFGNLFSNAGPVYAGACMGVDQAANNTYGDLPNRDCAEPDPTDSTKTKCGFEYIGLCASVCVAGANGAFTSCTNWNHNPVTWDSPVSAYLFGDI